MRRITRRGTLLGSGLLAAMLLLAGDSKLEKTTITAPDRPMPMGHAPQAVRAGDFLFLSGQLPIDASAAVPSELLRDSAMKRVIVFTRTKHGANKVAEHLGNAGYAADAIHGNKSQNARQRALEGFRAGRARILVATDIAARGIDIDDVTHVVNFELPDVAESYVHRIGRTARAGSGGIAIAFCDPSERDSLRSIEKLVKQELTAMGGDRHAHAAKPAAGRKPDRSRNHARDHRRGTRRAA